MKNAIADSRRQDTKQPCHILFLYEGLLFEKEISRSSGQPLPDSCHAMLGIRTTPVKWEWVCASALFSFLNVRPNRAYVAESVCILMYFTLHSVVTRNRTAETAGENCVSEYCCM